MLSYKHILFTSDFSEESFFVGKKAQDIAKHYGATLSIIHVVEQSLMLYGSGEFALPVDLELESKLEENAKTHIKQQAKQLGLDNAAQWVIVGNLRDEILSLVKKIDVDLIVVGAHDRHGLGLLFSFSTADTILHALPCDVIAIKVDVPEGKA